MGPARPAVRGERMVSDGQCGAAHAGRYTEPTADAQRHTDGRRSKGAALNAAKDLSKQGGYLDDIYRAASREMPGP
jgi:hypothetical protein